MCVCVQVDLLSPVAVSQSPIHPGAASTGMPPLYQATVLVDIQVYIFSLDYYINFHNPCVGCFRDWPSIEAQST